MSDKEQLFNRNIDKNAFDSIHSHSKYSSLGGSHSIDKKRRKLKNANSFKKKRSKATSSSKKSEKAVVSNVPFTDAVFMKNYRSSNLTTNKIKNSNSNHDDNIQKRYQYHKRIRSETGNTIINPLEQLNEKYAKEAHGIAGAPTITKTTDITTPVVPSDDNRFSINDKSNSNGANTINTMHLSKYEFAPSFTHHKNISLDSNVQYRKFTTNKNPSTSHKIDISKIKKSQKYKANENKNYEQDKSPFQIKNQSPIKSTVKAETHVQPKYYNPALMDFRSGSNDNYIENMHQVENLLEDNSFNEYDLNRGLYFTEQQAKIEAKKAQQLEGDHTISISKETEECAYLSHSKHSSNEPIQIISNVESKRTSERKKDFDYDNFKKTTDSQEILPRFEQSKPNTKIVQID